MNAAESFHFSIFPIQFVKPNAVVKAIFFFQEKKSFASQNQAVVAAGLELCCMASACCLNDLIDPFHILYDQHSL